MGSYDDIEGFIDYASEDAWKKYIESYVIPLWKHSRALKDYWERLEEEFNGLPFDEVREEEKQLLLGGVTARRNEMYTRKSLAKFYDKFFGLRLKDLQSWILQSLTGEAITDIKVEVVKTEFMGFVEKVFDLLDYGIRLQGLVAIPEEPELDYEELKKDPIKVRDLIKDFYQGVLNISLNHNYGTFFLCSINQITYRYMKAAYPRIDDALNLLEREFGLTKLAWKNPIKPGTKTFRDYVIYCFPEYDPSNGGKSFGGAICKLNEEVWRVFSDLGPRGVRDALSMLFGEVPDLKKEFIGRVRGMLPERFYKRISFKGISARGSSETYDGGGSTVEVKGKSIMDMLDENSPFLFTNLVEIRRVSDEELEFTKVG